MTIKTGKVYIETIERYCDAQKIIHVYIADKDELSIYAEFDHEKDTAKVILRNSLEIELETDSYNYYKIVEAIYNAILDCACPSDDYYEEYVEKETINLTCVRIIREDFQCLNCNKYAIKKRIREALKKVIEEVRNK